MSFLNKNRKSRKFLIVTGLFILFLIVILFSRSELVKGVLKIQLNVFRIPTARESLDIYLNDPSSSWKQKMDESRQHVLNTVSVMPGMALPTNSIKLLFDFLPAYTGRVRSISFTITDTNSSHSYLYTANIIEHNKIIIRISPTETSLLGLYNCITNIDVTLNDGSIVSVYNRNVCFNVIRLDEPIENYSVFSSNDLFLIIPTIYQSYGENIIKIANKCSSTISKLFDAPFLPKKSIIVMENRYVYYNFAGFGSIFMGNNLIESLARMGTCNDVVLPHELTHVFVEKMPISFWANEGLATYSQMTIRNDESIVCGDNSYFSEETGTSTPYANLQLFGTSGIIDYRTPYCFWKLIERDFSVQSIKKVIKKLADARAEGIINPGCAPNWSTFLREAVLPFTSEDFFRRAREIFGLADETTIERC